MGREVVRGHVMGRHVVAALRRRKAEIEWTWLLHGALDFLW